VNVGVWAVVVLVVEVEPTLVVGGGVVVVDVAAFWHPMIEVIKTKLTRTSGKP
jgi:hypothetical protein